MCQASWKKSKTIYASATRSRIFKGFEPAWVACFVVFPFSFELCWFFVSFVSLSVDLNELLFFRWFLLCVLNKIEFSMNVLSLSLFRIRLFLSWQQYSCVAVTNMERCLVCHVGSFCKIYEEKTHVTIRIVLQKRRSRMDFNLHSILYTQQCFNALANSLCEFSLFRWTCRVRTAHTAHTLQLLTIHVYRAGIFRYKARSLHRMRMRNFLTSTW